MEIKFCEDREKVVEYKFKSDEAGKFFLLFLISNITFVEMVRDIFKTSILSLYALRFNLSVLIKMSDTKYSYNFINFSLKVEIINFLI